MHVRKVKSLIRKIIGRPSNKPYTIDAVQKTINGYCITGWYFNDEVTSLSVQDKTGGEIQAKATSVPRDDVFSATGRRANGFELHVQTSADIENCVLIISLSTGVTLTEPLTLNEPLASSTAQLSIESTAPSSSGVKASCEYIIETSTHYYAVGWVIDEQKVHTFSLCDSNKNAVASFNAKLRIHRKDVAETFGQDSKARNSGFSAFFEKIQDTENTPTLLGFEYDGQSIELPIGTHYRATDDQMTNAKRLLNDWHPNSPTHLQKAKYFSDILSGIYPKDASAQVTRVDYHSQPTAPSVSLIIPLYGRYDFMRYQLSHFGLSDETKNCEVIYVVDDPKIAGNVAKLAQEMALISSQPFSILQLAKNLGYSKANNIGVAHAAAPIVALLNSDILPKSSDWLTKLTELAQEPQAGIVGARLLFEDDSMQHDGMAPMTLPEYSGLLFNDHPRKGWPKSLSPFAPIATECALLTAACWVLKKADFEAAGGFDTSYVLGDFEDSDLCLRMIEIGKTNYIRRDVELYHLERQSQNLVPTGRWKHNITILNAVKFNNQWQSTLKGLQEVEA